jgi:5-methylcytosine-specific restriction endonuclease McrA
MDDLVQARRNRLTALGAKVTIQHCQTMAENRALIQALIALILELDPIRRQTMWPAELVRFIAHRQDWICPACGTEIPSLNERAHHVDHVVPWSLGGGNEVSNLQILHVRRNLSKGQRCDPDDLIRYLQGRLMNLA